MDKPPEPPKSHVLSEDQGQSLGAGTPSPTNLGESTGQDRGSTQPSRDFQAAVWNRMQNKDGSSSNGEQGGQLGRRNSLDESITSEDVESNNSPTTLSVSQAPTNRPRENIVNDIVDLADRAASIVIFGSVGIGKSSMALTLLQHNRTKAKFGQNRYLIPCEDLNSLEGFLARLSCTIKTDVAQLRSHLQSPPPLILLLDSVDSILDPLTPQSQEIYATIEEFGNYEHVCLVTTSRSYHGIRGFHRVEVPTLSEDGARDSFFSHCNLPRSPAVDSLIAKLDFHPFALELLASCVRENKWDEHTLLKAWDDNQTSVLKGSDHPRLRDAIELVLRSPTINRLGSTALDILWVIAASPCGVEDCELEEEMAGTREAVDVLCRFSLLYRQGEFVKMFAQVRPYFLEPALVPAQKEQVLCLDADRMPGACMFLPFHPFHRHDVTYF